MIVTSALRLELPRAPVGARAALLLALGLASPAARADEPAAVPAGEPAAVPAGDPAVARADEPAQGEPADGDLRRAAAQRLLLEGNQLLVDAEFVAALQHFQAAYLIYPSPKIFVNLGTTYRLLGRNAEAYEAYEAYLADPKADPGRRAEIKKILQDLDALVGRIRLDVDDAATVRMDGKPIEGFKRSLSLRVDPGEHTIVGAIPGSQPAVETVVVRAGEERAVRMRFVTEAEATVPAQVVSWIAMEPIFGKNTLYIGLALTGVGLAGLLTGSALGVSATIDKKVADDRCDRNGPRCEPVGYDHHVRAQRNATLATVAFAVGGGGTALGGAILLTTLSGPPKRSKPAAPRRGLSLVASPGPGAVHLAVGGLF